MPRGSGNVEAVGAVRGSAIPHQPTRAEKAQAFGTLNAKKVTVIPPTLEAVDTASKREYHRARGTAKEWRNAINGALTGEGPAFTINNSNSAANITHKVLAIANRTVTSHDSNQRLATVRTATAISKLVKLGYAKKPDWYNATKFSGFLSATAGISAGLNTALTIKRTYDMGYEVAADISRHKDRQKLQKLVKEFDPISYKFRGAATGQYYDSAYKQKEIKELSTKANKWNTSEGGNIWRNKSQRTLDVLSKARDLACFVPANVISPGISAVAIAGSTLATIGSGIGCVGHIVSAANSYAKMGVQMSAMANIEAERQKAQAKVQLFKMDPARVKLAPTNQLIESISNRMIQERTYASRLLFWSGTSFAVSAGAQVAGLASAGVGYIAGLVISGASLIGLSFATNIFNTWHARTLTKRREMNTQEYNQTKQIISRFSPEEKMKYFKSLDNHQKIGLLERHLLETLREGNPQESKEVYDFLIGCGISANTVKSFVLMPPAEALGALQTQLYSARAKTIAKNAKFVPKVVGYMSGVTYLSRYVHAKKAEAEERKVVPNYRTRPVFRMPQPRT